MADTDFDNQMKLCPKKYDSNNNMLENFAAYWEGRQVGSFKRTVCLFFVSCYNIFFSHDDR